MNPPWLPPDRERALPNDSRLSECGAQKKGWAGSHSFQAAALESLRLGTRNTSPWRQQPTFSKNGFKSTGSAPEQAAWWARYGSSRRDPLVMDWLLPAGDSPSPPSNWLKYPGAASETSP